MKQSKIIGLTGSIATGKSAATNIIKSLGYEVIDADLIARDIINEENVVNDLKKNFGDDIYKNNELNREELGKIIFSNIEKRNLLNEITHPAIYNKIKEEINKSNDEIIFLDIPLLIETIDSIKKYNLNIDEIWLVYLNKDEQISRLMKRDSIDYEYAKEKIASQISVEDKKTYADVVLDNSLSIEDLEENIKNEIKKLKNR